jgi:mevalonate kinase
VVNVKQGIGKSHGKIILIGEHAVVYDAYAIAVPFFSTHVIVTLSQGEDTMKSLLFNGKLSEAPEHLHGLITLYHHLKEHYQDSQSYHIDIKSTILQQRGMGSSAALAHALVSAYGDFHQLVMTDQERFNFNMIAETLNHGKPSGIDSLTTMSDTPIFFKKGPWHKRIEASMDGYLIVVDSGIVSKTKDAVASVAAHAQTKETKQIIAQINELTCLSKTALESNQLVALGNYLNQAHQLLDDLKVSHPTLNHMVLLARDAGALGAKMTGGGHGGCMIALVNTKRHATNVLRVLKSNGYHQSWMLDLKKAFS